MNEIFRTIAVVIARQVTKAALVAQGMSEVAADMSAEVAIDSLASIINRTANRNDREAHEAMGEIRDGILMALEAKRDTYEGGRAPSGDDVDYALVRFAGNTRTAGSHKKRWILFNALMNGFRPEFYNDGLAQILFPKLEALEYNDVLLLDKVLKANAKYPVILTVSDVDFEYARRLEQHRLVIVQDLDWSRKRVDKTGISKLFRDFVLEEFWKEETSAATD